MKKTRNKNRRRTSRKPQQQEGFLFVGPVAVILLVVATVSLSYLYLHNQCDLMGKDIMRLEGELRKVKERSLMEQSRWSERLTLRSVQDAVARHNLNMTWPDESRIVRVRTRVVGDLASLDRPAYYDWAGGVAHD